MANTTLQIKRTSVPGRAPKGEQIDVGELAINLADSILYSKDGSGNIIEVGLGSKGDKGDGLNGDKGDKGDKGDIGATGDKGQTGDTGLKGDKGELGATGDKGDKGDLGTSGDKGQKGETGAGDKGDKGDVGSTGLKGDKGDLGNTGDKGEKGVPGEVAEKGQKGEAGTNGAKGDKGDTGTKGDKGDTGTKGDTGSKGDTGNFGGASFDFTFDSSTTSADPGTGKLRFNNATISSATALYIDNADDNSTDVSSFLTTIDDSTSTIKGHFRVSKKANDATFAIFTISSLTDNTGWFTVNVAYIAGNGTFTNADDIVITFARTGDVGDKGQKGDGGSKGDKGDGGTTGLKGDKGDAGVGQKGDKGDSGGGGGFTNGQSIEVSTLVVTGAITANSSNGSSGQVLTSNGTGVYWSTVSGGGGGGAGALTYAIDTFTANGTGNTFTLSQSANSTTALVAVDGLVQVYTDDYTINNTTLTFVDTPDSNSSVQVYNLRGAKGDKGEGGLTNEIFFINEQTLTTSYTIPADKNAGTFGPLSIANDVTVSISNNSVWTLVL